MIVDLSTLRNKHHERPDGMDEHLAGIITVACTMDADAFLIDDTPAAEEAFVMGYVTSLNLFVNATTGGMVNVDQGMYHQLAYAAFVDHRGSMWTYAVAAQERAGTERLQEAYAVARKASTHHRGGIDSLRDSIADALAVAARDEQARAAMMLQHAPGVQR